MNREEAIKLKIIHILNDLTLRTKGKPFKKSQPVRLRDIQSGIFITLPNGKTIWPSIGAAKCAIRLYTSGACYRFSYTDYSYCVHVGENIVFSSKDAKDIDLFIEHTYQELLTKLEFVPV